MASPYEIPYQAGSTPAAETHTLREGGQTFHLITDQRTVFAQDLIQNFGGIYDAMSKIARFRDENQQGFESAVQVVSDIPYYELPRSYAKYAQEELSTVRKDAKANNEPVPHAGLEVMYRSVYSDNPLSKNQTCRIMAGTENAYNDGLALIDRVKQLTPDQEKNIAAAIKAGTLNDEVLTRHNLTVGQVEMGMSEGTLDRSLGQRVLNLVTPAEKRTIDSIKDEIKDGRLIANDFTEKGADIGQADKLTAQQAYDLRDVAKKRATQRERDMVETLQDMGYQDRSIGYDVMAISSKKAYDFIESKRQLLTPDQKTLLADVQRNGRKNSPVPAAANELATALEKVAPGVPAKAFEPQTTATLRVVTASTAGLAGYPSDDQKEIGTLTADQLSPALKAKPPKPGDLIVVGKTSSGRYVANPTSQTDRDYAVVEYLGSMTAARAGATDLTPAAPGSVTQGSGMLLMHDKTRNIAAIATNDKQLVTVPGEAINGEAKLLQNVSFAIGNGEIQAPAPERAPAKVTRSGGGRNK